MEIYIQKATSYNFCFYKGREKQQNICVRTKTYVEWCEIFIFIKPTFYAFWSLHDIYKRNVISMGKLNAEQDTAFRGYIVTSWSFF